MPRGNRRGRGGRGENFKNSNRNESSIHDRLGKIAVYPKTITDTRPTSRRYKYVKQSNVTSATATVPGEPRIRMLAKRFLKLYYEIFDQPGRANIESMYNSEAFFSFSSTHLISPINTISPDNNQTFGRNLVKINNDPEKVSLLIYDKTNIARFLTTFWPRTEHLVNYLSIDIPFYIVNPLSVMSMKLVINGVFKDASETTNPLKAFTRVFVLKQVSVDKEGEPKYEIFNDLFMIQPPTPDQIKKYHQDLQIANRLSQNANQPNTSSNTIPNLTKSQQKLLEVIMMKTKMYEEGSMKLLVDCDWDEHRAMETFIRFSAENKIPQEFFAPKKNH